MSAVLIANKLIQHSRSKHLDIDMFFVQEKIVNGTVEITHVSSEN